jgi:hypothetical protein
MERVRWRRSFVIAVLVLISTAAELSGFGAGRAFAQGSGTTVLCKQYSSRVVTGDYGRPFILRNDWWGSPGCLLNRDLRANFRVLAGFRRNGREPVAYPEIFAGCNYGLCSPGSKFPRQVSQLHRPAVSWYTRNDATGRWNTALDIWFGRTSRAQGHPRGAELMIWLTEHGGCCFLPNPHRYWIDGRDWYLVHWRPCLSVPGGRACWNYIQFRAVRKTSHLRWLRLTPFIRIAERHRLISPAWWLWNIEAGNEIWWGGKSLATTSFYARS